jgi:hypothetical protein
MLSDAKAMDLTLFPENIRKFLHSKTLKKEVNKAAHVCNPLRIHEAIINEQKETKKEKLLAIFNIVYADFFAQIDDTDESDTEIDEYR